ncbi:MAG TPA: menaquinone biosynthesis protein [Terriglobales bacterium]|nr:menaquinone biosynthesis protein [Terriglobales bacterium]
MSHLRISAISFLNTAPLMWDFEHGSAGENFDIFYTVPSACAADLAAGKADIGIIPAAAYTTVPNLVILPGIAIASLRAVRSILLVSKVPVEKIQTVALDTSSLTSVALVKVLFAKWWGGERKFTSMAPELQPMLQQNDAALLIGDSALQVDRSQYLTYDLAEEWFRLTGKPFVFAFWAVRKDAIKDKTSNLDLAAIFQQSRDHGLAPDSLNQIASEWASRVGLSEADVRSYLTDNIHYYLDSAHIEGLGLYYRFAEECGALPTAPALDFLATSKPALI